MGETKTAGFMARMALFVVFHTAANVSASRFFSEAGLGTIFWPAGGIAVAAILMGGLKYMPALLVACLVGGVINGRPWEIRGVFIACNCLEAVLAWLLVNRLKLDTTLGTARDYLKFLIVVGILLPVPGALIAATALSTFASSALSFKHHAVSWWMGNSLGIILLTPMILVWRTLPGGWFNGRRMTEATLGILMTVASGLFFLNNHSRFSGPYPRAFVAFVFISWAAMRFGRHATLLVIAILFTETLLSYTGSANKPAQFADIWLFLVTLSTVGMALATAFNDRKVTMQKLSESLEAYRREEQRRREADSALHKTSLDFQRLVETAEEGVWTVDTTGTTTFVNRRLASLLGYEISDMIGKPVTAFIKPELSATSDAILSPHKSGMRETYEFPLLHKQGREVWVYASSSPITDTEGNVTGGLAMITDITERKKTDLALRESEDRYRKLVEAAHDAIIAHQSGFIVFANPAAVNLIGAKSTAEIIGRNALEFVHPDDKPFVLERMKKAIQPGANIPAAEERFIRVDGSVIRVEVSAAHISWDGRAATMVVARKIGDAKS